MRRPDSYAPPRRRRAWSLALGFGLVAAVAPIVGAGPASAAPAPLVTTDGVGIRVDETAIQGPALEAIETATQPFVDSMVYDGGVDGAPIDDYEWLRATSNLELSFDVLPPSGTRPDGGLKVHADILNIQLEYRADPIWPFSDCSIYVRPSTATIDATASVNRSALPGAPLTIDPIQATWDDDPDVSTTGVCWSYLIDDLFEGWWDDFVGNDPQSTASRIEAELNGIAQDLIDQVWDENVKPVLDSLDEFGVSINQLRTDDHGLIVTANTDATNLTIPGFGGPYNVSGAEDSGADSNINTLLANRTSAGGASEAIVSIHPNVVNQFMHGLDQFLSGHMSDTFLPASIEQLLLPPAARANYDDDGWGVIMQANDAPYTTPAGAGGRPQLRVDDVTFTVINFITSGGDPIATFEGSMAGLDLVTDVRPGSTNWGPSFTSTNATASLTLTQANPDVALVNPSGASFLPTAKAAFDKFVDDIFITFLNLAPIELFGMSVDRCTNCGRYSGDERYTETFKVN